MLKEEPYIYVLNDYKVFVVFFVDDIQLLYYKDNVKQVIEILRGIYKVYELTGGEDVK